MNIPHYTEEDLFNLKKMRLQSILSWYHIMIENILHAKYEQAIEDSTMITYTIRKMIEEQDQENNVPIS